MRQFPTAEHVNCFLGNLLTQLAFGRVDRKDAVTLAYVSQLLLNTFPAIERERKEELNGITSQAFLDAVDKARAQAEAAQASNGTPQSVSGEPPVAAGSLEPLRRRTVPSMRLREDDFEKVNRKSAMPLAKCRSCPKAVGMKAREKRGQAIRQRTNLGPHHDFARAGGQAEPRATLLVELERFRDIQIRDRNLPSPGAAAPIVGRRGQGGGRDDVLPNLLCVAVTKDQHGRGNFHHGRPATAGATRRRCWTDRWTRRRTPWRTHRPVACYLTCASGCADA